MCDMKTLCIKLLDGKFDERDTLVPQRFLLALGCRSMYVSFVFFTVVYPQSNLGKLIAHVIKVFLDIVLHLLQDLQGRHPGLLRHIRSRALLSHDCQGRRNHRRIGASTDRAGDECTGSLCFKSPPVLEPPFEFVAVLASQIVNNHRLTPADRYGFPSITGIDKKQPASHFSQGCVKVDAITLIWLEDGPASHLWNF